LRGLFNFGRIAPALCLAFLGLGAPSLSWAQGLPAGSYSSSCNNAQMVDGVLEASCQKADGSWADAAMPNAAACQYGVENDNGVLTCSNPPPPPPPVQLTSQTSAGMTTMTGTCANQTTIMIITTNSSQTSGFALYLDPGQNVRLAVTQGASFIWACGTPPTDYTHFEYFKVTPQ
jgi:hypothetical protein